MKTSVQLKALLNKTAKEKGVSVEVLLRSYFMERFLERVAFSPYKNNFILKGGLLISFIVGIESRTTMDLDATIKGSDGIPCGFI